MRAGEFIKGIEKCHKKVEEIIHHQDPRTNQRALKPFDTNVFANASLAENGIRSAAICAWGPCLRRNGPEES